MVGSARQQAGVYAHGITVNNPAGLDHVVDIPTSFFLQITMARIFCSVSSGPDAIPRTPTARLPLRPGWSVSSGPVSCFVFTFGNSRIGQDPGVKYIYQAFPNLQGKGSVIIRPPASTKTSSAGANRLPTSSRHKVLVESSIRHRERAKRSSP